MVMELCQNAVTPFDRRGGTLQGMDLVRRPRVPLLQGLRRQPQGERMRVQRGPYRLTGLPHLGFSARATGVGDMVLPIDPWQQALLGPVPPWRGDGCLLHVVLDALPPPIDQGGEGRHLATDFFEGVGAGWHLLALRSRGNGVDFGVHLAVDLGRGLRRGIVEVKRMQGEREGLQVVLRRPAHMLPSLDVLVPHRHVVLHL